MQVNVGQDRGSVLFPRADVVLPALRRGLRRFPKNLIPACLSFRSPTVLRKGLHSATMRPFPRLAGTRKSGAAWYKISRQPPESFRNGKKNGRAARWSVALVTPTSGASDPWPISTGTGPSGVTTERMRYEHEEQQKRAQLELFPFNDEIPF